MPGIGKRQCGFDGVPFEDVTEPEQLQDVGRRPFGHPRSAPGEVFDQALLREQPQRLTQRRPADPEVAAQLLFDDLVARSEVPR